MIWLLACGERETLVDERRPIAAIELSGRTYRWEASLRGWRHGWSLDPTQPHAPYDAVYVGWEVTSPPLPVAGAVDQTWDYDSVEAGRERFLALALEHCQEGGVLAYRLLPSEPWRVLVPDAFGAAGGTAPGASCEDALAWAGAPEDWRRDRAAHLAVCAHLYRSRRLDEAVRCLLREPEREGDKGRASRQDIPRAAGDRAFDGALLAVLDPAAAGDRSTFSPSRVRDLLAEVKDQEQVRALARRYQGVEGLLPWQEAVVGLVGD